MYRRSSQPTDCFMGAKGQGGLDAELAAEFATTTLNPVLLDSVGTYLLMYVGTSRILFSRIFIVV